MRINGPVLFMSWMDVILEPLEHDFFYLWSPTGPIPTFLLLLYFFRTQITIRFINIIHAGECATRMSIEYVIIYRRFLLDFSYSTTSIQYNFPHVNSARKSSQFILMVQYIKRWPFLTLRWIICDSPQHTICSIPPSQTFLTLEIYSLKIVSVGLPPLKTSKSAQHISSVFMSVFVEIMTCHPVLHSAPCLSRSCPLVSAASLSQFNRLGLNYHSSKRLVIKPIHCLQVFRISRKHPPSITPKNNIIKSVCLFCLSLLLFSLLLFCLLNPFLQFLSSLLLSHGMLCSGFISLLFYSSDYFFFLSSLLVTRAVYMALACKFFHINFLNNLLVTSGMLVQSTLSQVVLTGVDFKLNNQPNLFPKSSCYHPSNMNVCLCLEMIITHISYKYG
ncbi:hypothetical protein VP01_2980g1 [Puccinia sorghi]|uniref:Uncharacterized protein n=1 Tax=Puccinia sorghi TaxID=27349 RepID=A0A0L6V1D0_9BASI|nr:hypothetical protein VP01_2980g1 [Puccinia sorghi]